MQPHGSRGNCMKNSRHKTVILSSIGCAVLVFAFILIGQREKTASSRPERVEAQLKPDASNSVSPVPPLALPTAKTNQIAAVTSTSPSAPDSALVYDESVSFEENLRRLREFCDPHAQNQKLPMLLDSFVKALVPHAKTEFRAVKQALDRPEGTAAYRNLLLACLVVADGPVQEKADLVWRIALSKDEKIEVRRTATYLTSQIGDTQKRPDALYALLNDSDSEVVISALANSTPHLDERSYNVIKNTLVNSTDVHVRVAAVSALGRAPYPDKQQALREIVLASQTSKEDAFSEASLPKRAAIAHLDIHDPETYELVKQIALNDNEDPGVRAKAIGRFTPAEFPGAIGMLVQLLQKLDAENTVALRAVVDALLTSPTPENLQLIRKKANEQTDLQVRDLILKRIEIEGAGGGKP
jgi:hypothetical protein